MYRSSPSPSAQGILLSVVLRECRFQVLHHNLLIVDAPNQMKVRLRARYLLYQTVMIFVNECRPATSCGAAIK